MGKIVVTEVYNDEADLKGWYVDGRKVYDYHDPYFDELLQAIFQAPEFRDFAEFKTKEFDVEDWNEFDYKLPETI